MQLKSNTYETRRLVSEGSIKQQFKTLYPNAEEQFERLMNLMDAFAQKREPELRDRDLTKTAWLDSGDTVGMMLYVDLFADNLKGITEKIDYFKSLGVTLVHLMPLLRPREGENDGGYAVSDYRDINPKLGTMDEYCELIRAFHREGIRTCIDYVLNHTAEDHQWAMRAKAGEVKYQNYYRMYDSDEVPKRFEETLGQVFPKVAPGNFTYNTSLDKWVMTTFYPFQWDLNYDNPEVFVEMVDNLLFFANIGVDMIRLDAIPYIWKTIGTNSRNLPEVHIVMSLMRSILETCAPSVGLLGEAIVSPDEIVKYFGSEQNPECHILYNASYMVEIWNTLATRDARHIAEMKNRQIPNNAHWINYARCHDDIGWGLDEEVIRRLGFEPEAHKFFLIDFYYGTLKDSFSKGELYEFNPHNMDARNSGTFASLCGLERALEERDQYQYELALKRIRLVNALIILKRGIPMLYSGDEYGQLNDYSYKNEPNKRHDSRWLHRPRFNWKTVSEPTKAQKAIYEDIRELIGLRRQIQHGQSEQVLVQGNPHVLMLLQSDGDNDYLYFFNVTEDRQWVYTSDVRRHGLNGVWTEIIQGKKVDFSEEKILLGPYEFLVLKGGCQ